MSMTKEQFMAMDLKDKKQLLKEWGEALDEEDKETRCICGCALEEAFVEAGGEFCCQSCEDDAEKGREKAEEEDKEEEEQYHKMCENDCCTMLTKDTPIMCYKTDTKEMTLCSTCYWEAGYWEDDENSDNEDEIEEHKLEKEESEEEDESEEEED